MIIPSIDLMNGQTVQLIGGKEKALDAGDPRPIASQFGMVGEIAVIDLDAALGQGSNAELIRELLQIAPCRVGGGIRDVQTALDWLDAGARKVILGTAARPEILSQLPRDRVIAALDAIDGEVVVEGWRTRTGSEVSQRMAELRPYVSGFLVTFVEREGRMGGVDQDRVRALVEAAGDVELTIAGGVATAEDVALIDRLGADAQVGMALYTGKFDLADALAASLQSDRADGLWPTVVTDSSNRALGLTYSSLESLKEALKRKRGVYQSRSRGLWIKGEQSGATQELLSVSLDCDRDALRFVVEQSDPGFCHKDTWTCWGDSPALSQLEKTIARRSETAPSGSYTRRLLDDAALLGAKLVEEAQELGEAQKKTDVTHEAADVLYFTLVAMAKAGVTMADVEQELARRALKVTRRPGNAKVDISSTEGV